MPKIKLLHVDDSAVIRGIVNRILAKDDDIEIIPAAANGELGVEAYKKHNPDMVLLDIEMPVMDGISALSEIMAYDPKAKVIMCSTLSVDNAEITIKAMRIGAIDYIPKPTSVGEVSGSVEFKDMLLHKIKNIKPAHTPSNKRAMSGEKSITSRPSVFPEEFSLREKPPLFWKPSIVAIGSSTGGPQALFDVIEGLKGINVPVVITQHMPATFTTLLAKHIAKQTEFVCEEADDGMEIKPGVITLARGGKHMNFIKDDKGVVRVRLDDGPMESFCKPAVDSMYRSLVDIYGGRILSVILTGMGYDGRNGVELINEAGGYCIAQDQETSVVWGMPGAVASKGLCSEVLPLSDISPWIRKNINIF